MAVGLDELLRQCDSILGALVALLIGPLSVYLLISGLDDLILDLITVFHRRPNQPPPAPERPTAVLIPLWQEHEVIEGMLRHNLSVLRYANYDCFIGVYPNDRKTVAAVDKLASVSPRVHPALLPHDGPTVKADCLNWCFQHMLLFEEIAGVRYENIVIHDAEDVIHPDSFTVLNWALRQDGMAQFPVLPLSRPLHHLTHGLYCDDFAEGQLRHLTARVAAGAFLPGCGVGTGFSREAIEALASSSANQIFDTASLTEDYDIGLRLCALGFTQTFLSVEYSAGEIAATREYFPDTLRKAVRQRSRWIIGNALQSWAKHGWGSGKMATLANRYFLWRDRKGIWGNPLSLLCNLIFCYALLSLLHGRVTARPWQFAAAIPRGGFLSTLYVLNAVLYLQRAVARMWAVAQLYGPAMGLLSPIRMIWGNCINCLATFVALSQFAYASVRRQPLRWVKTQHAFPNRIALTIYRRRFSEVLVQSNYISQEDLDHARTTQPDGRRLGEHLISLGYLSEGELYEALSLQSSIPLAELDAASINDDVLCALPSWAIRHHNALPFRIDRHQLSVATPDVPSEETQREIASLSALEIAFHLVTPAAFRELLERHPYYRPSNDS